MIEVLSGSIINPPHVCRNGLNGRCKQCAPTSHKLCLAIGQVPYIGILCWAGVDGCSFPECGCECHWHQ